MQRGITGVYETFIASGERVKAFVPAPLPPKPGLRLGPELRQLLDQAILSLGRLDGISALLPDPNLFLYTYVRKEAVLSSQIEGTQSSLSDLLLYEIDQAPGVPINDVIEVSNYVRALQHGLKRVRGGFPISARLLRELHRLLLAKERGATNQPGEFRRSQNWIGGTRPGNAHFVPPPHQRIAECMAELETFIHEQPSRTNILIKAALSHVQFETIHPFLDGNGRVGRLLITLLLCADGVLQEPLLYLSLFFMQHRAKYYRLLDTVRRDGDWEAWLAFFLEATRTTADGAIMTTHAIVKRFARDDARVAQRGRGGVSAQQVLRVLQERPVASIASLSKSTKLPVPTVTRALSVLESLRIVTETSGKRRGRIFTYTKYLELLNGEPKRSKA